MRLSEQVDRLESLSKRLNSLEVERDLISSTLLNKELQIAQLESDISCNKDALDILIDLGKMHRTVALNRVSSLVTSALRAVFGKPYDYSLVPQEKRGQIELQQVVKINGVELDPGTSMGGGVVDVISMSLRMVLWSMMPNRTSSVMLLDEPFRCVSADHIDAASELLKRFSSKLGIQMFVVTHRSELSSRADKSFIVSNSKGLSSVSISS